MDMGNSGYMGVATGLDAIEANMELGGPGDLPEVTVVGRKKTPNPIVAAFPIAVTTATIDGSLLFGDAVAVGILAGATAWYLNDVSRDLMVNTMVGMAELYREMKGERGWQGKSQNTDNPYEKWRNSKTGSPNKVAKPDGKGGFVDVDRPPNWYDHKRPDGGNISKKK